jgi:putative transposase
MRERRIVEPGFPHHVILRGNNRRRLFSYPRDYKRFLELLASSTERHAVGLHHYCLMSNHVHLMATPDHDLALSSWVKDFGQRYASLRNRARQGTGKLFEQRFKSFVIDCEPYLVACSAYIERNPLRAGLVPSAEHYPWSSYRALAQHRLSSTFPSSLLSPTDIYRGFGLTAAERARGFAEWIAEVERRPDPELPEKHARAAAAAEALSEGYYLRLERPDGTSCK